jgi:hypothetical protein
MSAAESERARDLWRRAYKMRNLPLERRRPIGVLTEHANFVNTSQSRVPVNQFGPVCTENLSSGIVVVKSAKDGV